MAPEMTGRGQTDKERPAGEAAEAGSAGTGMEASGGEAAEQAAVGASSRTGAIAGTGTVPAAKGAATGASGRAGAATAGDAPVGTAAGTSAGVPAAAVSAGGAVNAAPPGAPLWFPDAPSKPVRLLPPLALAYIGDAVFEVAVRQHVMSRANLRPHHLHRESTRYVSAKAQAQLLALLEPQLTEDERDVVRQGRNAKSGTIPKNADVLEYRHATAFESLVGYLYYTGAHDRLRQLVAQGFAHLDSGRRD